MKIDVHLRLSQEKCDHLQNIGIALRSVVELRGVDGDYRPSVKSGLARELDLGRARLQAYSDP